MCTLDFSEQGNKQGFVKATQVIHIPTISQVIEKCAEYNQPLYIVFIDYEKAFDSVDTSVVMQALRNQGVDEHYIKLLEDTTTAPKQATLIPHKESSKISIKKGVTIGDTISPVLFTVSVEVLTLDWEQVGARVNGKYISNLRFADDIAWLKNSEDELQSMSTDQNRKAITVGLKINMQKTEVVLYSLG